MLAPMDAAQAIADLTEISPQVKDVVVIAADGSLTGSNLPDPEAGRTARRRRPPAARGRGGPAPRGRPAGGGDHLGKRVRRARRRAPDRGSTTPEPTVGLVFYDLKTCLRSITGAAAAEPADAPETEPAEPAPKPRRRTKKQEEGDDAAA